MSSARRAHLTAHCVRPAWACSASRAVLHHCMNVIAPVRGARMPRWRATRRCHTPIVSSSSRPPLEPVGALGAGRRTRGMSARGLAGWARAGRARSGPRRARGPTKMALGPTACSGAPADGADGATVGTNDGALTGIRRASLRGSEASPKISPHATGSSRTRRTSARDGGSSARESCRAPMATGFRGTPLSGEWAGFAGPSPEGAGGPPFDRGGTETLTEGQRGPV